ncbi:FAD:protein FMN transferase [Chitiniphilus purpureus]|uniref:FAD:protein FMN transferase n=1 Tax=Chitiniphilus purpureus TaxID=2981137 RepID=A0ABY6DMC9_9NEIS|nr:FAD:protein FMN transferase [Chitiniphilus sp. CD1]UXY14843.1 FAD:protein FMN transferase [Chitiniphilus sp. CD1]
MNEVLIPPQLSAWRPHPLHGTIQRLTGQTMGTTWSVQLAGPAALAPDALRDGIQGVLDQVVAQMSHWRADSDLSRFNAAPAGSWQPLPPEFRHVLACALAVAAQSDGAFDPTLGALADLWGFGPAGPRDVPPTPARIALARECSGWRKLLFHGGRARQPGGLTLDFSGIAKGYGVDAVATHLQRSGLSSWLVEVGGELRGFGIKPDGQPWWVGLEAPLDASTAPCVAALHDLAVATSGDYRRYFEHQGERYAHTLDPRTGAPLRAAPAAVTVLHPECMWADAYATALTVLGPEQGLAFAERHALAARWLVRDRDSLRQYRSAAFAAMLK